MLTRKQLVTKLLKGIETGDPESVAVVNESQYIQHNPLTRTGNEGLAELFARLAKTNPRVEIVRVFQDGDFVFAHTDYDFNEVEVGFEVFRFEGDQIVEHWDNLQSKPERLNPSGRSMLDGPTEVGDLHRTESNKALVRRFVEDVLLKGKCDQIDRFVSAESYLEHNPTMSDGLEPLKQALSEGTERRRYETVHRVLGEGNFVLGVSEGFLDEVHVSFYDMFRIDDGKIVEHWDTLDEVPPREQWVNDNGKF